MPNGGSAAGCESACNIDPFGVRLAPLAYCNLLILHEVVGHVWTPVRVNLGNRSTDNGGSAGLGLQVDVSATVSKLEGVQVEGGRKVKRSQIRYNLDMIISIGYPVKRELGR